jgi:hypothetical protein
MELKIQGREPSGQNCHYEDPDPGRDLSHHQGFGLFYLNEKGTKNSHKKNNESIEPENKRKNRSGCNNKKKFHYIFKYYERLR